MPHGEPCKGRGTFLKTTLWGSNTWGLIDNNTYISPLRLRLLCVPEAHQLPHGIFNGSRTLLLLEDSLAGCHVQPIPITLCEHSPYCDRLPSLDITCGLQINIVLHAMHGINTDQSCHGIDPSGCLSQVFVPCPPAGPGLSCQASSYCHLDSSPTSGEDK